MPADEIDRWYDAMDIELQALQDKQTMTEINRCDVPKGKQIVKSTWAFKRKRRPNDEIYKLKARFVVRGDLQRLNAQARQHLLARRRLEHRTSPLHSNRRPRFEKSNN